MGLCADTLQVPDGVFPDALRMRLAPRYGFADEPAVPERRTWLDTFDWRLHAAGVRLELAQQGRRGELRWYRAGEGHPVYRLSLKRTPRFPADLPTGPLREDLARLVAMRALLPLAGFEGALTRWRVLDREAKTVVRLELEQGRYRSAAGEPGEEFVSRLQLCPVRGYPGDLTRVRQVLLDLGAVPGDDIYTLALRAQGRVPGDYSTRLDFRLNPTQPAGEAAREIHLTLLGTLEANLDGTCADLDSEFLHDLRVATRRTRSALGQLKGVFPAAERARFREDFAWVQRLTGPTRDLDVYLLALDGYKADLPPQLREALTPMGPFLQEHQRREQRILAEALRSPRFCDLLADWRSFLTDTQGSEAGGRLVKELADRRIRRLYRRVLEEGRAIGDGSPAEALHELRKSCKKLRYVIEFFSSIYDKERVCEVIRALKRLLDNLGLFQDLEVQAHALQRFAAEMVEERRAGTDTLLAMGALIGELHLKQRRARRRFARVFAGFDTRDHRDLVNTLLRSVPAAGNGA